MGDYYGYNPKDYQNNFDWIGDIGKTVSRFAGEMPELLELNKSIKENNMHKQRLFSEMSQGIDSFDDKALISIAQQMGISEVAQADINDPNTGKLAKEKLKKRLNALKFTEKDTNETYTKTLLDEFLIPATKAANRAGITTGAFAAHFQNNNFTGAIEQTKEAQLEAKQQQYLTDKANKFGPGGEADLENQKRLELQSGLDKQEEIKKAKEQKKITDVKNYAMKLIGDGSGNLNAAAMKMFSEDPTYLDDIVSIAVEKLSKDDPLNITSRTKVLDELLDAYKRTKGYMQDAELLNYKQNKDAEARIEKSGVNKIVGADQLQDNLRQAAAEYRKAQNEYVDMSNKKTTSGSSAFTPEQIAQQKAIAFDLQQKMFGAEEALNAFSNASNKTEYNRNEAIATGQQNAANIAKQKMYEYAKRLVGRKMEGKTKKIFEGSSGLKFDDFFVVDPKTKIIKFNAGWEAFNPSFTQPQYMDKVGTPESGIILGTESVEPKSLDDIIKELSNE